MRVLVIDIGTGTQDILLFDSERSPENCLKLVMPSPTLRIAQAIRQATARSQPLLLTGVTMGGGPCAWAAEDHLKAGLAVYATPDAARTFDDDLEAVQSRLGVRIVAEEEARRLAQEDSLAVVEMADVDYPAVRAAFSAFGVDLSLDALVVGVFDHGHAPPGVSDRQFRLDYLRERLSQDRRLSTFAFKADAIPPAMTRLRAAAETAARQGQLPVYVMDTAPAAVLGALEDPSVRERPNATVVNVGNFHTLAFQFLGGQVARLFEHHTGLLNVGSLSAWLARLADGSITHEAVFAEHGHGAAVLDATPVADPWVAVIGPRRSMLRGSALHTYFAVPHGDQMLAGCFGMVRALADLEPGWAEEIERALASGGERGLW